MTDRDLIAACLAAYLTASCCTTTAGIRWLDPMPSVAG
jgi:hypothetical protein